MGSTIIAYLVATAAFMMGIYMTAMPQNCTKEDKRKDSAELKKTRNNGIVLAIAAIAVIIINTMLL